MSILYVDRVTVGYSEVDILHGVQLEVASGKIVSIIGPNGAGKSTLLKTIFGLLTPRRGKIMFKSEEITGRKPDKIAKLGISYVPQVNNVFPSLTVEENLEMGAFIRKDDHSRRREEIYELFPVLGERKNQKAELVLDPL